MHYPNVHLYTKDWAWKLIIIILPAIYKLWNFQKCNVSHGGIAQYIKMVANKWNKNLGIAWHMARHGKTVIVMQYSNHQIPPITMTPRPKLQYMTYNFVHQ